MDSSFAHETPVDETDTENQTASHAQFVGSIPENYDRHLGPLLFEFSAADIARRDASVHSRPGRLLEVACGTGISTEALWRALGPGVEIVATDLNDASTRKDFLDASLSMFKAARSGVDPTASCGSAYWKMLSHVVAIGEGDILLDHLISQRLALMRKHLPMSDVERMQEIVLDGLPRRGPEPAIAWIAAQRRKAASRSFLNKLTMAECEIRMHYQGESNTVNNLLVPLIRQTGEIAEIARIRMGDLAFVSGDLNRATELYADVQNRVRHHRNATSSPGGRTRRVGERVDNWKLTAFLGVSVSETVKSLMDQGQLSAAHKTLQAWERQFPLSKVSGDYVLQEARYYMALEDWVRARSMLEAYCELVDASSYIPDASLALLTCMLRMDAPQEEVRTFCKAMSERLAFHPAGETFRARLRGF